MLPIVGASLAHGAPVASMFGHAVASVLLLVMWAASVVAVSIWVRSTFLTLLFTLMVPALGLGAVAALPLLADRVDDAGLAWASRAHPDGTSVGQHPPAATFSWTPRWSN